MQGEECLEVESRGLQLGCIVKPRWGHVTSPINLACWGWDPGVSIFVSQETWMCHRVWNQWRGHSMFSVKGQIVFRVCGYTVCFHYSILLLQQESRPSNTHMGHGWAQLCPDTVSLTNPWPSGVCHPPVHSSPVQQDSDWDVLCLLSDTRCLGQPIRGYWHWGTECLTSFSTVTRG